MPLRPADFGLPSHFKEFRRKPDQWGALCALGADKRRFSGLSAPPGSGKSLLYMTLARVLDIKRVLVLTGTKGLQDQIGREFASMGLADMRGQSNYRCIAVDRGGILAEFGTPGASCADGPCRVGISCPMKKGTGCGYYDAQARAEQATIVVANYAYWLTLGRHGDPNAIGQFDLLVLDEAHAAPQSLADFCAVELNQAEIHFLIGMDLPLIDEGTDVWASWAASALTRARSRYADEKSALETAGADRRAITQRLIRLGSIGRDLLELSKANEWQRGLATAQRDARVPGQATDWIPEATETGLLFSPVWAHAYAETYLFRGIPRVVLSSGTLTPNTSRYLGIAKADYSYHEVASGFEARNRPVTWLPTVRVDHKMSEGDTRVWVNKIDRIIAGRLDRKGVIHARSYAYARQILTRSKYASLMISHDDARGLRDAVAKFKLAKAPAILISPAVTEGFDFPLDECLAQGTRVLRRNLVWSPIEEIKVGDELVAIDEETKNGPHGYRCLRYAHVLARSIRRAPVFKITTTHGTIRATANHPFLVRHLATRTGWVKTSDLRVGWRFFWVSRPVSQESTYEAGYLGGFFDGEGHLAVGRRGKYSTFDLGVSQRPGPVMDRVVQLLKDYGMSPKVYTASQGYSTNPVHQARLRCRMSQKIEFLARVRPERLIAKVDLDGKTGRDQYCAEILSIEPDGVAVVHNMETTTGTFVAEGFATHNCRFQVIVKLPFLDMRNPVTKARCASDKRYADEITSQVIMQQAGRAVRSVDDRAETFIIDDHWDWFRGRGAFPAWFRQSFRVEDTVPQAMSLT